MGTDPIIPCWAEVLEMRLEGAGSDLGRQYCRRDTLLPELGTTLQPPPPTWPLGSSQRPPPPGSLPGSPLPGWVWHAPGLPQPAPCPQQPGSSLRVELRLQHLNPEQELDMPCAHHIHHFRGLVPSEKTGCELPATPHWVAGSQGPAGLSVGSSLSCPRGLGQDSAHSGCSVSICETKERGAASH